MEVTAGFEIRGSLGLSIVEFGLKTLDLALADCARAIEHLLNLANRDPVAFRAGIVGISTQVGVVEEKG